LSLFRGLSATVSLWLLGVFVVVSFVGWHLLRDIAAIHVNALRLETINHQSHYLHELEMGIHQSASLVSDFLISGSSKQKSRYKFSITHLKRVAAEAGEYGLDTSAIEASFAEISDLAERIFSLPYATGNMEGPLLMQEMNEKLDALSGQLTVRHHEMDNAVNESMRFVAGLRLDMRDDFLLSLLVIFGLLAGLTVYLSARMMRPLVILRSRVAGIGDGELVPQCPDFGDNEIGDLSRALNLMGEALKKQNEALIHAQSLQAHHEKMHALGLMTSSIAHEVGNPLTAASVALQVAGKKISAGKSKDVEQYLKIASDELGRTEGIIQNILEYGRPSEGSPERVDMQPVIESSLQLVGLARKSMHVSILFNPSGHIPQVIGHPQMLRQVLVNLVLNAIDASSAGGEVRVAISQEQGVVCVDVSDQGCGVDDAHVDEIFSPMFTTKPTGKGSGLGLSISRDLMQQMNGNLLLVSNTPEGCTFRMQIPRDEGDNNAC